MKNLKGDFSLEYPVSHQLTGGQAVFGCDAQRMSQL